MAWKFQWTLRLPRVMDASACEEQVKDETVEGQGRPLLVHSSLKGDFDQEVHQLTEVVLIDAFGRKRNDYFLLTFRRTFTREELLSCGFYFDVDVSLESWQSGQYNVKRW